MLCMVLISRMHLHHLPYIFQECVWAVVLWMFATVVFSRAVACAEIKEDNAFLWLQFYHLVRDFFQPSVYKIKFLETRQVLPQVLGWMACEELLHFNKHIKGTNEVWVLRMQSLCYSGNTSHYNTHILSLLDSEIDCEVIRHCLNFQQL